MAEVVLVELVVGPEVPEVGRKRAVAGAVVAVVQAGTLVRSLQFEH